MLLKRGTKTMKALALAIFAGLAFSGAAFAEDQVTVQLDYVVRGNHAMFFVAKEKGYFQKQGINVTAIHAGGCRTNR